MSWSIGTYISTFWTQHFAPPPSLNEHNVGNLSGKVFIVTGGSSGVGAELSRILYQSGGTVYIMTRDEKKSQNVIDDIIARPTTTPGKLRFIHLDLQDLSTVQPAVETFLSQESQLHVLWNNAGVGGMAADARTAQGIEANHGINDVGPYLLTQWLHPTLEATARTAPASSVRVVWTGSIIVDIGSPLGGVALADLDIWKGSRTQLYSSSRVGNYFLASEFDRRFRKTGVLHLVQNPGTLKTGAWRYAHYHEYIFLWMIFGSALDGANTSLWSGLDPSISLNDGGRYVIPWGRWHPGQRPDILEGLKSKDEGGSGAAEKFYLWCEEKVADFKRRV